MYNNKAALPKSWVLLEYTDMTKTCGNKLLISFSLLIPFSHIMKLYLSLFSISSIVGMESLYSAGSNFDNSYSDTPIGSFELLTAYFARTLFLLLHISRPIVLVSSSVFTKSSTMLTYVPICPISLDVKGTI